MSRGGKVYLHNIVKLILLHVCETSGSCSGICVCSNFVFHFADFLLGVIFTWTGRHHICVYIAVLVIE